MVRLYSRVKNIFKHTRNKADEDDYREYVLQRLFPAIRYGRDNDLERYIMLRESGKTSKEWGGFYANLELRYTEIERRRLIRNYRKNAGAFNTLFQSVLGALYRRVSSLLYDRIDELEHALRRIESDQHRRGSRFAQQSSERGVIGHLEKIITLCSPDVETADEGVEFLRDFAEHNKYKHQKMKRIAALVKSYLDGTLFEEAQVKETYHFDIHEERKKHYKRPSAPETGFKLQILITKEDVAKIVIPEDSRNEYELAFRYYEQYLRLIDDHEFATKVYVYSKKHSSIHHQIYDVIRKGIDYGHQKGRIFDDVFKIIAGGRYVFDIRSEQMIEEKLKGLGVKPARTRVTMPNADRLVRKAKPQPLTRLFSAPMVEIEPVRPAEKTMPQPPLLPEIKGEPFESTVTVVREKTIEKKPESPAAEPVAAKRSVKKPKRPAKPVKEKPERGQTTSDMWKELSARGRVIRQLNRQFKARLPVILTEAVRHQVHSLFDDIVTAEKLRELIYYVQHNYDRILAHYDEREVHKQRIESLGSTIQTVSAAIMQSANDVKAQYLGGEIRVKGIFG